MPEETLTNLSLPTDADAGQEKTRLSTKWARAVRRAPVLMGSDEEFSKLVEARRHLWPRSGAPTIVFGLLEHCQEMVLTEWGQKEAAFRLVLRILDTTTLEIVTEAAMELRASDDSADEVSAFVDRHIAFAITTGVPVFGNTPKLHDLVEASQARVIKEGFTVPDGDGTARFKLREYENLDYGLGADALRAVSQTRLLLPGEVKLAAEGGEAKRVAASAITSLTEATKRLRKLLALPDGGTRDEASLQRCLEENPILFGTEYKKIHPQHRLGAEFQMDYALERYDGNVDLVEIEASSLRLYNRKGDPRSELVHAEQQAMDWFEWIEANIRYARDKFPNLSEPVAFVVIGRASVMTESERSKLARRNQAFGRRLTILTYDDFLKRAETILTALTAGAARIAPAG